MIRETLKKMSPDRRDSMRYRREVLASIYNQLLKLRGCREERIEELCFEVIQKACDKLDGFCVASFVSSERFLYERLFSAVNALQRPEVMRDKSVFFDRLGEALLFFETVLLAADALALKTESSLAREQEVLLGIHDRFLRLPEIVTSETFPLELVEEACYTLERFYFFASTDSERRLYDRLFVEFKVLRDQVLGRIGEQEVFLNQVRRARSLLENVLLMMDGWVPDGNGEIALRLQGWRA